MLVFILQTLILVAAVFLIGLFLGRLLKKRFCKKSHPSDTISTQHRNDEGTNSISSYSGGVQATTGFSAKSSSMWSSPVSRNEAAAAATVATLAGVLATKAHTATDTAQDTVTDSTTTNNTVMASGDENTGSVTSSHVGGVQPTTGYSAKCGSMWNASVSRNEAAAAATVATLASVIAA